MNTNYDFIKAFYMRFGIFLIFLFFSSGAYADVFFYDMLALKDETVMLKAETKGTFFSRGGEMVEFVIDGKSEGKALSGGDGFAFKEFSPHKTGLHKISVISGKDKDAGLLLSLIKGDKITFVDFSSLFSSPFSQEPMKESRKVIKALLKRMPVVFLQTGLLDVKAIRKWLVQNSLETLPVVQWREGRVFEDAVSNGLKIKFIIGSASVINSAKNIKAKKYSFEEAENAEEVRDWEEIGRSLRLIPGK